MMWRRHKEETNSLLDINSSTLLLEDNAPQFHLYLMNLECVQIITAKIFRLFFHQQQHSVKSNTSMWLFVLHTYLCMHIVTCSCTYAYGCVCVCLPLFINNQPSSSTIWYMQPQIFLHLQWDLNTVKPIAPLNSDWNTGR